MHCGHGPAIAAQHRRADGHIAEEQFLAIHRIPLLAYLLQRFQNPVGFNHCMAGMRHALAVLYQHQRLQRFYIGAGVTWYSLLDRLNIS